MFFIAQVCNFAIILFLVPLRTLFTEACWQNSHRHHVEKRFHSEPEYRQDLLHYNDDVGDESITGSDNGILRKRRRVTQLTGNIKTAFLPGGGIHANVKIPSIISPIVTQHTWYLLPELYAALALRDNLVYNFGYLLQVPHNSLTQDQYEALYLIHSALRKKHVYTYNLLSKLCKLNETSRKRQMQILLDNLANNLSPALQGAAKFLASEILRHRLNVDHLLESDDLNFYANIDMRTIEICRTGLQIKEAHAANREEDRIQETIGKVFVKILRDFKAGKATIPLPQLFGIILANLPLNEEDPVLEEHIQNILSISKTNKTKGWPKTVYTFDVYEIVQEIIEEILENVNFHRDPQLTDLYDSLIYVRDHLKVVSPENSNPFYLDWNSINGEGLNLDALLSLIPVHSTVAISLKNRILHDIQKYSIDIDQLLNGFNRFNYENPFDLLLAILSRLQNRLSYYEDAGASFTNDKIDKIQADIKALTAYLIASKHLQNSPRVKPEINVSLLLSNLQDPSLGLKVNGYSSTIMSYIREVPEYEELLNDLIPDQKEKCSSPRICLINTLKEARKIEGRLPHKLRLEIRSLLSLIMPDCECNEMGKPSSTTTQRPETWTTSALSSTTLRTIPLSINQMPEPSTKKGPIVSPSTQQRFKTTETTELGSLSTLAPPVPTTIQEKPTEMESDERTTDAIETTSSLPTAITESVPSNSADEAPILPPDIDPKNSMFLYLVNGQPQLTTVTFNNDLKPDIILPSLTNLMKPVQTDDIILELGVPFRKDVIEPLNDILGEDKVKDLLNDTNLPNQYKSRLALMMSILKMAKLRLDDSAPTELVNIIDLYIKSIEIIEQTMVLPVVASAKGIRDDVIYISSDSNDLENTVISGKPPSTQSGKRTVAMLHPKFQLRPVDAQKPFEELLPQLPEGSPYKIKLEPLIALLKQENITSLLGKDFVATSFPNRMLLLMATLRKLIVLPEIKADAALAEIINEYLQTITIPVEPGQIPDDIFMSANSTTHWYPELLTLLVALPTPKSSLEVHYTNLIKILLSRENLLEELGLPIPPLGTTRGELLEIIIEAALKSDTITLDKTNLDALRYYKDKILRTGPGSLFISWVWIVIIETQVPLGDIIDAVIDYDKLPRDIQIIYNKVIIYLIENPHLLQTSSFPFESYHTQGTFIKGLFLYLAGQKDVSEEAKKDLKILIPYVNLNDKGSKPMPKLTYRIMLPSNVDWNRYDYRMAKINLTLFLKLLGTLALSKLILCEPQDTISKTSFFGLREENNFGHSGYVYLPSDTSQPELGFTKCQVYDTNKTVCDFIDKLPRNGTDLMVIKAWTAVTLRDNIVTMLGYLLHQTNNTLPQSVYTPLYLIYQEIRRNNIKTMDLLPCLKSMVKTNRPNQLIALFKSLHTVMPNYYKNVADDLSRVFTKKKNLLKTFLLPESEIKEIDLLHDIDPALITRLRFKSSTSKSYDKRIETLHGKEFATLFASIADGKILLSQPVLAVIMLNIRYDSMQPDDIEDLRYLTDVLRNEKIREWSYNVTQDSQIKDPYDLVHSALTKISKMPNVDAIVKDLVTKLLPLFVRPIDTSVNPYYADMKPFFGRSQLNITLLLTRLADEFINISEVTALSDMVDNNEINLVYAMRGFIRYYYDTPKKLLLAFLDRVKNRVPMNSIQNEVLKSLVSQLHEKHQMTVQQTSDKIGKGKRNMENINVTDISKILQDTNPSSSGNDSVMIHRHNLTSCPNITNGMPLKIWLESLNDSATDTSTWKTVKNVSFILGSVMNNSQIAQQLKKFYKRQEGNFTESKRDQLIRVLKGMLELKKIQAIPVFRYELVRVYCILMHGSEEHSTDRFWNGSKLEERPSSSKLSGSLIGNVSLPLAKLLDNETFLKNFSDMKPGNYQNKRLLLISVLQRMLRSEAVRNNSTLFNEIIRLLKPIQDLKIRFDELDLIVVADSPENEVRLNVISNFLSRRNLLTDLGDDFDVGRYHTKGSLLRAILEKAADRVQNNSELAKAIQAMLPKIDCSDVGAEPVEALRDFAMSTNVNFEKILDGALDKKKLTSDVKRAIYHMTSGYGGTLNALKYVHRLDVSVFETRADFLEGYFDVLVRTFEQNIDTMKKDVALMKSAILKTGSGAEPVDYL
ncbi:uncharacterized protein LOC105694805 [Orussus abietinus]|uniref:uncharacterized protein LOC105694805 n=1 Tax=Orussus abietinus TaxID=222816 RepID=UPI0006251CB1|nr:uncharacterized protein LOC105694805 [Orussus abietinus]